MSPLPEYFTTAEVASAFKITADEVRDMVKEGKVAPLRLSDSPRSPMRFSADDVKQLEKALRPVAAPAVPRRRRRRAS